MHKETRSHSRGVVEAVPGRPDVFSIRDDWEDVYETVYCPFFLFQEQHTDFVTFYWFFTLTAQTKTGLQKHFYGTAISLVPHGGENHLFCKAFPVKTPEQQRTVDCCVCI